MINELRELEKLQGELQQMIDRQDFSLVFKKISPLPFFNGYQRLQNEFIAGTNDHLFGQRLESFVHERVSQERTRLDALLNSEINAKEKEFEALKQAVGKLKEEQANLQKTVENLAYQRQKEENLLKTTQKELASLQKIVGKLKEEKPNLQQAIEKLASQRQKEEALLKPTQKELAYAQQEKAQAQKEIEKLAFHKTYALQQLDKKAEDWYEKAISCEDTLLSFYYWRRALELEPNNSNINYSYIKLCEHIAYTSKKHRKYTEGIFNINIGTDIFLKECLEYIQKYLTHRPDSYDFKFLKSLFLMCQRKYMETLQYINEIEKSYDGYFFELIAVCYAGLGNKQETIKYLVEASNLDTIIQFQEFEWLQGDVDFQRAIARFGNEI